MLSCEQRLFLSVISDYLNSRKTIIGENGINIALLTTIAKQQQCEAIFYYQTQLETLRTIYASNLFQMVNRKHLLTTIHNAFQKNGISYLIFKGDEVAQVYPQPALRSMGDTDILVHEKDKKKAHNLLLGLGFENLHQGPTEWVYRKNAIEFELHHRLMYDEVVSEQVHKVYMDSVWENVNSFDGVQYHLDWTYHLVYILLHLRKHFMNSGVGFRQFMDIAIVSKKCNIDWDKFKKDITNLDLMDFASSCYTFIKLWFGMSFPVDNREFPDDFINTATQQIFRNGVFGFDNAENQENYTIAQLKNTRRGLGKIRLLINSYFPSYQNMRYIPKYEFINNKPWRLPLAWCYRFIYSIIHKTAGNSVSKVQKHMSVTQEQILIREDYLRSWGLY